ncbi:hypothetical protein [Lewinella sp. IMCC34183]|uniref:hypothetical protein n=1 Tax=Lewinella sp. IMCC34183 TaxID=2248762 RepID=UPI000E22567E|nr:hypothetical protein [Lewinella sp. IMCC34183]
MRIPILFLSGLFFTTLLSAQSPVDVGGEGMQTTALEANTGADVFATNFDESNVGFMHVYVEPEIDPLDDYFFRGRELTDTAMAMLPTRWRQMADADDATYYGTMAIKGVDENLYITRLSTASGDQIDMFAIRDGKVEHLKTLATLNCNGTDCTQLDSYITDVNLDTRFDLIQIGRKYSKASGSTEERRSVYVMRPEDRRWTLTEELDVPWEGITFYDKAVEKMQR